MAQTAIAPAKDKITTLSQALGAKQKYLATVLPKHLTAERVIKVAITAASRTPALLQCTPQSFVLAVIQASQLGLEAGSPLGEAYLVPYKTECTLIVGYRGLIALARRSGEIESIEAHVVHARDHFDLAFGLDSRLEHRPWMPTPPKEQTQEAWDGWAADADPGPMIAVYAVAKLRGGQKQAEVMTRAQVDAIRARSRAGNGGPWVSDYEEMAKKTVVRRLAKYLPMSIEMAGALDHEDRVERGETIDVTAVADGIDGDVTAAPKKITATDAVKAQLAAQVQNNTATTQREPGDDDDDPAPPTRPTGTDGPRVAAGDDAEAAAFEAYQQAQASAAPQAKVHELRVERDEPVMARAAGGRAR